MKKPRPTATKHLPHKLKMEVKKQRRLTRVSIYAGPEADFTLAQWRKEAAEHGVGRPAVDSGRR